MEDNQKFAEDGYRLQEPASRQPNGEGRCIGRMAIRIIDFSATDHQKVRFDDRLYGVLMSGSIFSRLPGTAELTLHILSHGKILIRDGREILVKKKDVQEVEPHIVE